MAAGDTDDEEARKSLVPAQNPLDHLERDDFTTLDAKWLCLIRPARARETLRPWAYLELDIIRAKDLHQPAGSILQEPVPQAFVQVFLDDEMPMPDCKTRTERSWDPWWPEREPFKVPILAPRSMVRLMVYDAGGYIPRPGHPHRRQGLIGFVEFNVQELALGKEVGGWMELRFPDSLQRTSSVRYRRHCIEREDEAYVDGPPEFAPDGYDIETASSDKDYSENETTSNGSSTTASSAKGKLPNGKHRHHFRAKQRATSLLQSCCSPPHEGLLHNAGAILVKMVLRRVDGISSFDSSFAHAIDPRPPEDFGVMFEEEGGQMLAAQKIYDASMYIKVSMWDDTMSCVMNYIKYITYWRSFFLSLCITVALVATCYNTWLFLAVVPGMMGIALVMNAFSSVRRVMTTNGLNAPLNEDGLLLVCKLRSASEMKGFLRRLIRFKLFNAPPIMKDDKELERISTRCFRHGSPVPGVTFDGICQYLRNVEWVQKTKDRIVVNSEVILEERFRGIVKDIQRPEVPGGPRRVVVDLIPFETVYGRTQIPERRTVEEDQVIIQRPMPRVPVNLVPFQLLQWVYRLQYWSYSVRSKLLPALFQVRDVVTWKPGRPRCVAAVLSILLFTTSGVGIWLAIHNAEAKPSCEEQEEAEQHETHYQKAINVVLLVVGELDNVFILLLGLAILLQNAPWFRFFRSMLRILSSSCCVCLSARKGTKRWKFFTEAGPEDFTRP